MSKVTIWCVALLIGWPSTLMVVHPIDQSMPPNTTNPGYIITAFVAAILTLGRLTLGRPKIITASIILLWMIGVTVAWSPLRSDLTRRAVEERAIRAAPLVALGADAYYGRSRWNVIFDGDLFDDAKLNEMVPYMTSLGVQTLHLDRTHISDDGFAELSHVPTLRFIYLFDTKITDVAIERLKAKLPNVVVTRTSSSAKPSR